MASYHLSREALEDLDQLYEFGILTFGLRQADVYFDGIVDRFQEMADRPELYPEVDHIRQGYRRSVYKSHSIYYQISLDDIVIVRILGQQDIGEELADRR
ncbi:MAG: type II toxin-antitoxin system RelE/ParE family toxin [Chromatiaceae bacterium]|nr:type II toxin-antitoxin system RelE/ParE family toxin [Chromatiaceae bacterium]